MKHLIRNYSATCVGSLRQAIYRACGHLRPSNHQAHRRISDNSLAHWCGVEFDRLMDCKQCGAGNDGKAIECASCGGVLRRAYPYDPMGQWLTKLEDEYRAVPTKSSRVGKTLWPVLGLGMPAGTVGALVVGGVVSGWLGITAAIIGTLAMVLGALEFLPERPALARTEQSRVAAFAKLEQYRRDAQIQRWRLAVILAESLPRGSFLYQSVLAEDDERG